MNLYIPELFPYSILFLPQHVAVPRLTLFFGSRYFTISCFASLRRRMFYFFLLRNKKVLPPLRAVVESPIRGSMRLCSCPHDPFLSRCRQCCSIVLNKSLFLRSVRERFRVKTRALSCSSSEKRASQENPRKVSEMSCSTEEGPRMNY